MAWKPAANAPLGLPNGNPAVSDTVLNIPVGTIATFYEDTQGFAECIYLPGVVGLVAGDVVVFDLTPGAPVTTRDVKDTFANSARSVAVAIGAPQAGNYGWFQIGGVAIVNAVAGTVAGAVMNTVTTGQVGNTADPGDQIMNARLLSAVGTPAAGKAYVQLNRPCEQGQIT
jgi:hypothetical protein